MKRGQFNVKATDKILYALAPLPYATGLFPLALRDEIGMGFLPPVEEAVKMSFSERNEKGLQNGAGTGHRLLFRRRQRGLLRQHHPVVHEQGWLQRLLAEGAVPLLSSSMLYRLLRAKSRCKQEGRDLLPKDLFKLKGFMCAGTDSRCYKDQLEELLGRAPHGAFRGYRALLYRYRNLDPQRYVLFPRRLLL